MTPEVIEQWIKILRDLVVLGIGAFICIYEVTKVNPPNALAIGAGVTLLGVPAALRLDQSKKNGKSNGSTDAGTIGEEEKVNDLRTPLP